MLRRTLLEGSKEADSAGPAERSLADLQLHLSSQLSYPMLGPEYVQIGPVDACNARCLFCVHHSPLVDRDGVTHKAMLGWDAWRQSLDDIIALKTPRVDYIGIGEPLMHPRIADALQYGSRHLTQYMVTNGLLLRRHLDTVADHVDWLSVSLNAVTASTQHKLHLTGEKGFDATVEAIRALVARRERRGQVSISFVVNRENFRELAGLPRFCENLGVRAWLNPIGLYEETRAPLGLSRDDQRELDEILDRLSDLPDHHIRNLDQFRYFEGRDTSYIVQQIPCYLGLIFAQIRGDGSVSHCCACEHEPVGNVNEKPFGDIWTSLTYRRFRRDALFTLMRTKRSLPGCHCNICGLAPESIRVHNRLYGTNHTMSSLKASAGPPLAPPVSPLTFHRKGS
jgi:MoaA/NifB/PqqE/SkfB family radical SAM enzyme